MIYDPEKWHAVVYDDDGFVMSEEDVDGWYAVKMVNEDANYEDTDSEPSELVIVHGSAIPIPQSNSSDPDDQFFRSPGSWQEQDQFSAWDLEYLDFKEGFVAVQRAQAVAHAMNKADVA